MESLGASHDDGFGGLAESFDAYLNDMETSQILNLDLDIGEMFPSRSLHHGDAGDTRATSQDDAHSSPQEAFASGPIFQPKASKSYSSALVQETITSTAFHPGPILAQTGQIDALPGFPETTTTTPPRPLKAPSRPPPKIGKRFSSESVRVLKSWLSTNIHKPYPSAGDVEAIQRHTGLSRQQITTWLANARRRLKNQPERPPTPLIRSSAPVQIPATFEDMNPLQRWQNSPPEHEPATVSAIARAVRGFSSPPESPDRLIYSGDSSDPGRSLQSSSSAGSTQSSSAYSHTSGSSLRSLDRIRRSIKRRRRRITPAERTSAPEACHPFQCTFCTETFKTKWSWKRHEKSLHLSLERWECTPSGPTTVNARAEQVCVYCGLVSPDLEHLQGHNFSACHNRALEERTFYRKDHLQQHLKLVHNTQFMKGYMDAWKHESERIRSRCGFCGMVMNFWSDRVDHVAEHFRGGQTMVDWKGDWGFEGHMLDMVENSMPPCISSSFSVTWSSWLTILDLIHYERNSPWPFTTQQGLPESPKSAYELIKDELEYFYANYTNSKHQPPSDQELLYESCCIIFGSEILSKDPTQPGSSWLRDLLMSSDDTAKQARMRPTKSAAKSRMTNLMISGKGTIFEACTLEEGLQKYVEIPKLLGLGVEDGELQREASVIIQALEEESRRPSEMFGRFLNGLIFGSADWLVPFRRRNGLEVADGLASPAESKIPMVADVAVDMESQVIVLPRESPGDGTPEGSSGVNNTSTGSPGTASGIEAPTSFFLNVDSNCYRRLGRELARFMMSTMSPRNPNSHVPTDEELQHQARWIMFDDDDPWNQTPADNPDWLREFKKDVGLIPAEAETLEA
ncbi:hypothetical protein ACJZ2D_004285 [Fusarium nematophilum]